jgi:acetyl esterase/lipase
MKFPILRPVTPLYRAAATLHVRPRTEGGYSQECNHVYAEAHGMGLVMDVFSPLGTANGFGIVDVVSGGWHSDRVQLNNHIGLGVFDVLCAAGFRVFAVSPGSITKFTGLNMVRHVQEAIRYVKARADHFAIDPERLGLMGASAGGHLAALAALAPRPGREYTRDPFRRQNTSVHAVGLFFPPTDLLDYAGRMFDLVESEGVPLDRLLFEDGMHAHSPEEVRAQMTALSPARQVPADAGSLPPFLLIHGSADTVVPLGQSQKLVQALRAAGGRAELIVKDGGGHPWPDIRNEVQRLADWMDAALRSAA